MNVILTDNKESEQAVVVTIQPVSFEHLTLYMSCLSWCHVPDCSREKTVQADLPLLVVINRLVVKSASGNFKSQRLLSQLHLMDEVTVHSHMLFCVNSLSPVEGRVLAINKYKHEAIVV